MGSEEYCAWSVRPAGGTRLEWCAILHAKHVFGIQSGVFRTGKELTRDYPLGSLCCGVPFSPRLECYVPPLNRERAKKRLREVLLEPLIVLCVTLLTPLRSRNALSFESPTHSTLVAGDLRHLYGSQSMAARSSSTVAKWQTRLTPSRTGCRCRPYVLHS
jgi:hypothetical protein